MVASYPQVRDALHAVLSAALVGVEGAPALELQEPRLADPDPDGQGNRFRAMLMPLGRTPDDEQLTTPPPYFVTARFGVGLHGVGKEDTAREALLDAMTSALVGALDTDFTLGGVASYAEATSLESDTSNETGFAPETLLDLEFVVEFDAPTRLG